MNRRIPSILCVLDRSLFTQLAVLALLASGPLAAQQPPPRVQDVEDMVEVARSCEGNAVTISGTQEADVIHGTPQADVIHALGGGDEIFAGGGADIVCGGDGDDVIDLGDGSDQAWGGDGEDTIYGGDEQDIIYGGDGGDTIYGEEGGDRVWGEGGNDEIHGGCEPVQGMIRSSILRCNSSDDLGDTLHGGYGDDDIHGDNGADRLYGYEGRDRVYGDAGDDVLSCGGGPRGDHADGGGGNNTFDNGVNDCTTHANMTFEAVDFAIAKTPLGADGTYTRNDDRTFVVAGCVPQHLEIDGFAGSDWVACNDLDNMKDKMKNKVVESPLETCLDLFPNGVLRAFWISEVRNRKWQHFRFACRDLKTDGTVGSVSLKSSKLFEFDKDGEIFNTSTTLDELPVGIIELQNALQLKESLLSAGLLLADADDIFDHAEEGLGAEDRHFTSWVPDSSQVLTKSVYWYCPPGMVMTGAAIGHVPDKKDRWTRPLYILAECRRLIKE